MIRLALQEDDFHTDCPSECLLRIQSLKRIYGLEVPFLRFYTDADGSLLSLMDGVAVFYAHRPVNEEWLQFFAFQQEIQVIHTDEDTGKHLLHYGNWSAKTGSVLQYAGGEQPPDNLCETPYLPAVYELLAENFETLSPFEAWYVDYSHRVRHGHCHIAAVMERERPVSVATTVAETDNSAILGQVATDPAFRRRGYASRCVSALIHQLHDRALYILPINETAEKLYKSLGFKTFGRWAELTRSRETIL